MKIQYTVNGEYRECEISNDDILIDVNIANNRYIYKIKALTELTLLSVKETIPYEIHKDDLFFLNGYQSWTTTLEAKINFREKGVHKFKILKDITLRPYGDYAFYAAKKDRLHSYDFFYVKGENEIFVLNNNFQNAFLITEMNKKLNRINFSSDVEKKHMNKDDEFVVFDFERYSSYEEGLKVFNEKYPERSIPKIFGYTSWYNYYQNINEEIILRDLEALDSRFDLFQIDDGYQTFVGDWMDIDKTKFPNGLKPIVDKIHEKGLKAGLWLAPFVAERNSRLLKIHPEWIKKDEKGQMVKVGVNWSGQFALDLDNPEVQKYLKECFKFYVDMGFDLFKLDFLYSTAYVHDGVTHAEASHKTYKFLKDITKGKLILGCGATLSNIYQNFDYVRVGPDVSLIFDDHPFMRLLHRERPSTKNTILNTIYRHFMNDRLFANDPDVFLLRDYNIKMNKEQKRSLITMNALFGSLLMTSDDIATYDEEKKELLEKALHLFKNAKDVGFETKDKYIHIYYTVDDVKHEFDYYPKKGVMKNER